MYLYEGLKYAHITTALLSISLFLFRAAYLLQQGPIPRPMRYLPHINDSLLFALGVWMLWYSQASLAQMQWLQLKLVLIVVYILLGMYSLKWARGPRQRLLGVVLAVFTFGLVVSLAINKPTF